MNSEETRTGAGQQIAPLLLGASISGVLFSASIAVPWIGFAAGFLAATPLCYTRVMSGRTAALLAALIAASLIGIGFKPLIGAWYLAQCGSIGVVLPELLLRGKRPSSSLLWTTAAATAVTAALALSMSLVANQSIQTIAQREITTAMEQVLRFYEQQNNIAAQDLETLQTGMKRIGAIMLRIYPALATINLALVSLVTMLAFQRLAARRGIAVVIQPFREFKTPEPFIWLLIIAGFAMLAPTPLITTPALNILVLLVLVYFCQGLAVLSTFTARTTFTGMLNVLLGIVLLTQPYLVPIVAIIGIFDLWGEFRTPRIKQDENL